MFFCFEKKVLKYFKSQILKMHTGVSTCAICHHGISMYTFCGCNPFLGGCN
ncbi:hypothetical protein AB205_0087860 [Aquarana catesbeiana]|uniref:Uncharacterized protein n=1 Tax=Aquarana catesbeiana TaxID=8400 RepID=A0A2G9SFK2_AQUCT|nr:hypothetical protein AB205_0087860 [Aquarana catesbeiana]